MALSLSLVIMLVTRKFVVVDEGNINFSHTYNLYHYGIFSFLPDSLADGTNEVLAMLLITPFAQTYESIFISYFLLICICLIVSIIYIFKIIKNIFPDEYNSISILLPLSMVAVPISRLGFLQGISGGFANILSAALFLITLHSLIKGNYKKMSLFAFLCAFSRLDSILWLFAVFVADTIAKRKINWHLIISSLAGLFTLLLFFKLYYGWFIPTPVLMKNATISFGVMGSRFSATFLIVIISILSILLFSKFNHKNFFVLWVQW